MRFKRPREQEATLTIAPLIDMVFLLLVFFLVTYHFDLASGVPIQLPKVAAKNFDEVREKVTVLIDKSGQIYLKGSKLDLPALRAELKGIVQREGAVSLVLQADKDVPHGIVVEAMDAAKTAGVRTIIIAAQWRPEKVL
jgi:biopolymer transport protein ExbD